MAEITAQGSDTTSRTLRAVVVGILLAVGAGVAWHATDYELGTLRRMGPGYFPLMLGASLCVLAVLIWFIPDSGSAARGDDDPTLADESDTGSVFQTARSLILVLGAMAAFAALVRHAGFAPATAAATFVAGLADPDNSALDLLLLCAGVTAAASLVFIVALGVPVPLVAF